MVLADSRFSFWLRNKGLHLYDTTAAGTGTGTVAAARASSIRPSSFLLPAVVTLVVRSSKSLLTLSNHEEMQMQSSTGKTCFNDHLDSATT